MTSYDILIGIKIFIGFFNVCTFINLSFFYLKYCYINEILFFPSADNKYQIQTFFDIKISLPFFRKILPSKFNEDSVY